MREIKQSRALATRKRIVREAARLFSLKGYHDTKLEEVLKGAQVTTGAFFHHFDSKEDLGFTVIESHMKERRRELERIEKQMRTVRENSDPLVPLLRRLDAIRLMVRKREKWKGGCASLEISARPSAILTTRFESDLPSALTRWLWSSSRIWTPL